MSMNLLTTNQAAKQLSMSAETLRRWESMGRIVSQRTEGGHRRFLESDVEKLLREINQGKHQQRTARNSLLRSKKVLEQDFVTDKEARKFLKSAVSHFAVFPLLFGILCWSVVVYDSVNPWPIVLFVLFVFTGFYLAMSADKRFSTETGEIEKRMQKTLKASFYASLLLVIFGLVCVGIVIFKSKQIETQVSKQVSSNISLNLSQKSTQINCPKVKQGFAKSANALVIQARSLEADKIISLTNPKAGNAGDNFKRSMYFFSNPGTKSYVDKITNHYETMLQKQFVQYQTYC